MTWRCIACEGFNATEGAGRHGCRVRTSRFDCRGEPRTLPANLHHTTGITLCRLFRTSQYDALAPLVDLARSTGRKGADSRVARVRSVNSPTSWCMTVA